MYGEHREPLRQVHPAKPLRVLAEEQLHLRPGEKLQAHRMNLARFHRRPEIVFERLVAARMISEKRAPSRA